MNFSTGIVYDYAPAAKPESSGTVTVVNKGKSPLCVVTCNQRARADLAVSGSPPVGS